MKAFQKSIYWNTSKMTAGPQLYIHDNINMRKMCQIAFMTGIYLWVLFLFFVHFSLCSLTRSARELTDVTDFVLVSLSYVLSLSSFLNYLLLLISLFLSVIKLYKNGRMNETSEESGNLWCKNLYQSRKIKRKKDIPFSCDFVFVWSHWPYDCSLDDLH